MKAYRNTLGIAGLVAALSLLAPPVSAQGFGGGGMPPEIAAKIKAWQRWRDSHKSISNLQTMLYQVGEMDKQPDTRLTKPQAAKLCSILSAWRNRPTMTDDQAKDVSKQIGAMLNDRQIKKMVSIQPPWMRGAGGGGGGGFRPAGGGGPRPGGRPGGFSFPDPPAGGYNPLNPDTLPFAGMRPQVKKRTHGRTGPGVT